MVLFCAYKNKKTRISMVQDFETIVKKYTPNGSGVLYYNKQITFFQLCRLFNIKEYNFECVLFTKKCIYF